MKMTKERESKRERKRETEKTFFKVGEAERWPSWAEAYY